MRFHILSSRKLAVHIVACVILLTCTTALGQQPAAPQAPVQPDSPTAAQQAPATPHPNAQPTPGEPSQSITPAGNGPEAQHPSNPGTASPQQESPQQQTGPITKQQAKELFRSVDQILQFASDDTGLPIKHSVKRKLITRQSVENYIEKRIKEDKDTQRVERSEAVLKKFGLLPSDYNLHDEFLRLLGEQVAAYYDAKTKTVNMLDWVPPDQQKPVLAHELTHALQDQKVGLEKWELAGAKDDKPLPDNQEETIEEAQAARQAVTEGQAMIVFLDYTLAPLGKDVLTAPQMVDAMRASMGDSKDSPVFAAAPTFVRESLLMPYTFGVDFERYVLEHKGKEAAFEGALDNPPIDTRQIMQPETYVANRRVAPLDIPDLDRLVSPEYERYDFGGMGEFDVYLLMKQYAPDEDAKDIYTHWRGGYYLAAQQKTAPQDQIALLYVSRWDSPEAAAQFAKVYEAYTPKRYPNWPQTSTASSETPSDSMESRSQWSMGPESERVFVEQSGDDLLIMEGFDQATAGRISAAILKGNSPTSDKKSSSPPDRPLD